jgi:hypothetical protein
MAMLTGGCHCGQLRYEAEGEPFHATWCHCTDCRRSSGAPAMAWFSIPASGFRVVAGRLRCHSSSERAQRGFCPDCGTSVTYHGKDLPEVDIATATLDDPSLVPPGDHIFFGSRVAWMVPGDNLPVHRRDRGKG